MFSAKVSYSRLKEKHKACHTHDMYVCIILSYTIMLYIYIRICDQKNNPLPFTGHFTTYVNAPSVQIKSLFDSLVDQQEGPPQLCLVVYTLIWLVHYTQQTASCHQT